MKRLLLFTIPHLPWLIITVLVSVGGAALTILTSLYLGGLTDQAVQMDLQGFLRAVFPMIMVLILQIPANYLLTYGAGRYGEYSLYRIRVHTAAHIQRLPAAYMEKHALGDLLSRLSNDVQVLQQFLQGSLRDLIVLPLTFAAAIVFLFILSFQLSLAAFSAIPIFMFLAMRMTKPMEKYAKEQQEALAEVNGTVQDAVSGLTEAKAFQLEAVLSSRHDQAVDVSVLKALKAAWIQAFVGPINNMMQLIPFILIFAYGGYLVIQGQMTFGTLVAYLNLTNAVVNPLGVLPRVFGSYRTASAAAGRILEVWDAKPEPSGSKMGVDHQEAISFAGVSFTYEAQQPVLSNLSFTAAAGETVALVGPSGCGKSTVLNLIAGFNRPDAGALCIFGCPIDDWDIAALRSHIAWVSQDTYLFPGSLYENIAYGNPDAEREAVYQAAIDAGIHDFIVSLPEGYDTPAGERGTRLSGGQRQRIAIARALLKDAPILLLDEATSALDAESEYQVQTALNRLMQGRTTLVVAHRLSTIRYADRIMVIEKGSLLESGGHDALMQADGLYKSLYNRQLSEENPAVVTEQFKEADAV